MKVIGLFNLIQDAQEASLDEKSEETIALCKKVLALDPGIVDSQFLLVTNTFEANNIPWRWKHSKKHLN
ncbi:MAG TPA: hypothetical protein VLH08_16115 [Acidobacteriota bacterium]|nr:hypothetical protein [Acidobacteriota bacterium]